MKCSIRITCIAALAAAPVLQSARAQTPAPAATSPQAAAAPAKKDYSKEAFVVESLESRARFENDGTGRFENTARIRVQSEAGVQALGQLVFPYSSATERLEISYVRVERADGSVVAADAASIQDLSSQVVRDAPLYSDAREKHVTVPALRPGETLAYRVAEVIEHPLAPGQFWFQYDFERTAITLAQSLELNVPASRPLHLKMAPGREAKIEETADRRIYRWTGALLAHSGDEPAKEEAKPGTDVDVSVTTFANWQEVGALYQSLERERIAVTPEIQKRANDLTAGKATPAEKLGALYDYVATNFRYVSLSFGSGRLQPHAAEDVLKNQYGDCKDKHTLLAALAAAEGIRVDAVLINSQRKLDADVPSPASFDHVITRASLGSETLWMDTTTEVAPLGFLSSSLRHKQALDVPAEGEAALVETPADPPTPVRQEWRIEGTVSDIGKLDAHVHYVLSGDNELLMRLAFRRTPEADWKKLGEAIASSDGLRGSVDEVKPSNPADTHQPFTLDYHLVESNFLDWSAKRVQLAPPLPPLALPDTDAGNTPATEPLELGSPAEVHIELKLTLPARYSVRPPVAISASRDYGEYRSTYSAEQNVLAASRVLRVREREIPPDKVSDFSLFFRRAVRSDEAQSFYLEASVAGAPAIPENATADDLLQAATGAYSSQRFALAEQLLERAVAKDPKHKTAWKLLGAVRLAQQENPKAIEAFRKQIELEPYDEFAYEGLGLAQAALEQYPAAIASFRKQLEVKPLDPVAQASLATTLVQARRYADAVPELEKSISLSPEDARLYVALGQAQLELHQNDKAQAAFDKAVEFSATPMIWNNIAYELSLHSANLDRAQQYAESAVSSTAAELRNADLEHVTVRDLGRVISIASYWDTLGWVHFQRGDLKRAERFVEASWLLDFRGEVGDHLGQIYEKQGHKEEARRIYALALAAGHSVPETRTRLEALAGGAPQADALAEQARQNISRLRDYSVGRTLPPAAHGTADFLVLLGNGGKAEAVRFLRGDSGLRGAAEKLRALDYGRMFPDDSPVKLVRRGTLSCAEGAQACTFTLIPADLVQSVE